MSDQIVYALNTVSNKVSKIDADLLKHPTFKSFLIEVDEPDACIGCGEQPETVTTVDGDELPVEKPVEPEAVDLGAPKPAAPKPSSNKPKGDK